VLRRAFAVVPARHAAAAGAAAAMGDGGAGASAALLRRGERTGSVGNERTGARASSTVREWWVPHAINGSLTDGATSCLTVGPRCHKPCQSAFSGRSVLFETNWPKCGSSVRIGAKTGSFPKFCIKSSSSMLYFNRSSLPIETMLEL
jgi:hypothetical protein